MKILPVNDEPALLKQAKAFLEKGDKNFEVRACGSTDKALELLEDYEFDVVVSDYQMPEIDVLDFLEVIRKELDSDIPFIMFTGKGRGEVAMTALNLGADRYPRKDGDPKSQYAVLSNAIRQEFEHQETRFELKKKNITLTSILKDLPIIVLVVDRDRRVKMVNETGLRFADSSREEILGLRGGEALRCLNRLDDPEGCGYGDNCESCVIRNAVMDTFETGERHHREKGALPFERDGRKEEITFWVTTSLLELDRERVLVSIEDITEIEEIKERLLRNEDKYRTIFESAHDAILILDGQEIIDCNKKALEMFGCERKELIGAFPWDISLEKQPDGKRSRESASKKIEAAIKGESQFFEWVHKRKGGDDLHSEVILNRCQLGGERCVIYTVRDITERKENQKRVNAEKDKRKTLLDNIPGYALILKKDTREIVFSNEKAKEVGAVTGETCFGTIVDRDDPCPFCKASELWETEERKELEVEYKGRYYHGIWVPYTEDLYVHYIFDITERKEVEERQEFLHSLLRHDVRNKIQIAQGYLQLMADDRVEKYSEKILKALKNADSIIEKIRILEDTDGDEKKTEMELSSIVDKIISQYQPLIKENEIEIEVNEIDCKVEAGDLLDALFMNLIENSIKHANCEKIVIDQKDDDECVIIVEDDGVGIPEKDKIFERGYKKGRNSGSGLGMYLVKKIAESYGGSVEVKDSELGGARFDVHLRKVDNISKK